MEDKVVNDTASFGGDVEPILPDGWKDGDNLFDEGTDSVDQLFADGQEEDPLAALLNEGANASDNTPTTGDAAEANVSDAGTQQQEGAPDGEKPEATHVPRKLVLKVNHGEEEVDVNALSDDELRALLQKGRAFDAMKDAENKRNYRAVYQEQIDAGMTEAAARLVAKDAAGGQTYALTDEEETASPAPAQPQADPTPGPTHTRDLRAEVEQLRVLYPDLKEMPDEVAQSISKGVPVLQAYLAYRDKQSATAAAKLRKENQILKQNAANSARAPVRGVSGGDSTPQKQKDLFEKGFDAGWEWN